MKSTKKKIPLIILTVLTIVLCVMEGCVLECPLPYAMTDGELRFGRVEGICSVAGVFFRLVNTGKKTISAVEMTCTVYDHSGKPSSFIGNNTIRARLEMQLVAGKEKQLCLVLDGYISNIPQQTENWLVDQLYPSRIEYEDGSSWSDPLGLAGG